MSSAVIATVVKMIESLPDPVQDRVADHLREYIEDLRDELQWDSTFKKPKPSLSQLPDTPNRKSLQDRQSLDYEQL